VTGTLICAFEAAVAHYLGLHVYLRRRDRQRVRQRGCAQATAGLGRGVRWHRPRGCGGV